MLASVRTVSSGGMSSPFLRSLVRFPVTMVSTVTMSTRYPAATARSTRSLFIPLSRWMYSWNHRSGWPGGRSGLVDREDTAAARSSIVVVAIVDVVEHRPRGQLAPHGTQVADVVARPQPPAGRVELDWLHPDQLTYLRCPHVRDHSPARPGRARAAPLSAPRFHAAP